MKEENFKKMLRSSELKSTAPRLFILKALSELGKPVTAPEIYKKLSAKGGSASGGKNLDLVTLYRTLASFEEHALIRRVNLRQGAVFYELNINHHHHIVCLKCGRIEDFESLAIEKVLAKVVKKSSVFKNIKEHSLEIFGFCKKCA